MNDYLKPKSKATHLLRGEQSEQLACDFLIAQGLTLVERNFRCPYGELDLIMKDGKTLVIVEVRYRKNAKFGSALESVTRSKQMKIIAATEVYLNTLPNDVLMPIRFDVVGILGDGDLQWVKNAFETY
ncbi:MAG: YraN family protein [Methylococcales bacterium]|jgi:putative endonuclease